MKIYLKDVLSFEEYKNTFNEAALAGIYEVLTYDCPEQDKERMIELLQHEGVALENADSFIFWNEAEMTGFNYDYLKDKRRMVVAKMNG